MMEEKVTVAYTENIDAEPTKLEKEQSQTFTGNVQLTDGDVTYLIPTPSTDPQGKSMSIQCRSERSF